jgi:putative restriction endonuclease
MLQRPSRRYWWVNQNKTYRQELGGGYMWAPKRAKNGARLAYYDNMREVRPGDVVFSFHGGEIGAIGLALSTGYDCIVPPEFEKEAQNWDRNGWRVDVRYTRLADPVSPREHLGVIAPLLPEKYSPLLKSGRGHQSYLSEISEGLAQVLANLLGREAQALVGGVVLDAPVLVPEHAPVKEWEDRLQGEIQASPLLAVTEKEELVTSRIGQGVFKKRVFEIERICRVTGVENPIHLIGSHIKPWRHSNNQERLDGENGLLLTPSIDHLFDKGYISFKNSGELLLSPRADRVALAKMGVKDETSVIILPFTRAQRERLEFHRDKIFLGRDNSY